jgi:regulator of sigma D
MENLNNIVETMIFQHRVLQKDLGAVSVLTKEEKPNSEEIIKLLKQFATDLSAHLQLENDVFYVQLLKKMKDQGQDTADTEQFILEMKKIGDTVMAFLGKYKEAASVANEIVAFTQELNGIIPILNLRIESEESGVYDYWKLYK